jgi:hypothetical protein
MPAERGLNDDGTIAREGDLDRVPAAFVPVVAAARAQLAGTFGTGCTAHTCTAASRAAQPWPACPTSTCWLS